MLIGFARNPLQSVRNSRTVVLRTSLPDVRIYVFKYKEQKGWSLRYGCEIKLQIVQI